MLHLLVSLFCLFLNQAPAQTAGASALMWDYQIPNKNLCARQSSEPTTSAYFFIDSYTLGRMALKLSDPSLLTQAVADYQKSHLFISQNLLSLILTGKVPTLTAQQLVDLKQQCADSSSCPALDEIMTKILPAFENQTGADGISCRILHKRLPLQFKNQIPTREELEQIALSYASSTSYVSNCLSENIKPTQNFDLLMQVKLQEGFLPKNWKKTGFDFWSSFKIYYSWLWTNSNLVDGISPLFAKTIKSLPIENQIFIMADGCKSISEPSCHSDFLAAQDIKNFAAGFSYKAASSLTAHNMIEKVQKEAREIEDSQRPYGSDRSILSNMMNARVQASQNFYEALFLTTALTNQKKPMTLIFDVQQQLLNDNAEKQGAYDLSLMCAESLAISNTELSVLAAELKQNKKLFENLKSYRFPGLTAEQAVNQLEQYIGAVHSFCQEFKLKNYDADTSLATPKDFKPWFRSFLSYFSLSEDLKVSVIKETKIPLKGSPYLKVGTKILCTDSIDCARVVMEKYVDLYNLSMYEKTLLRDEIRDLPTTYNQAAQTSCKVYDPWAMEQIAKKKLFTDGASAVLSGALSLPVYLNIDYQPPKVASFSQLVDQGYVKFDPQLIDQTAKKTLFLDLGPAVLAPCAIVISENPELKLENSAMAFKGITFGVFTRSGEVSTEADVFGVKKKPMEGTNIGAACTITFERVALTLVTKHFNIFRATARVLAAIVSFFRFQEDSPELPRTLEINHGLISKAFLKYGKIPNECVTSLLNGKECLLNEQEFKPDRLY